MKRVMPFVQAVRERVELKGGPGKQAMSVTMDFDESEVLKNNLDYLRKSFELDTLEIKYTDDPTVTEKNKEEIRPGCPFISFSVKPFVKVMFENPMPRSGLFSQHLTVSDGDTTKNLKEKLAKSVGLKGLFAILLLYSKINLTFYSFSRPSADSGVAFRGSGHGSKKTACVPGSQERQV